MAINIFEGKYLDFSKMDKNKCPKSTFQKNFPIEKTCFFGIFSLSRLFIYIIVYSFPMVTIFEIFRMILSSFSESLSPEPPHASTTILLYWSENLEDALLQSG